MNKKLSAAFLLMITILLCGCTEKAQPAETVQEETVQEETVQTTVAETTVAETTEETMALHSDLYDPDYTVQQIQTYFEEIVLNIEYTDGIGNANLVQKWCAPITYRLSGQATEEDLRVLETFFAELNQIPGFPGIAAAMEGETEQIRISFLEPDLFRDSFSSVVGGEDATGATQFWYYTDTNEIYSARIGYRTDMDQSLRNSVLLEEVVNTLGISDTVLREDSITYQYSDFNTCLSDVDWILLKLLYHPELKNGMDSEACASVIQQLYY